MRGTGRAGGAAIGVFEFPSGTPRARAAVGPGVTQVTHTVGRVAGARRRHRKGGALRAVLVPAGVFKRVLGTGLAVRVAAPGVASRARAVSGCEAADRPRGIQWAGLAVRVVAPREIGRAQAAVGVPAAGRPQGPHWARVAGAGPGFLVVVFRAVFADGHGIRGPWRCFGRVTRALVLAALALIATRHGGELLKDTVIEVLVKGLGLHHQQQKQCLEKHAFHETPLNPGAEDLYRFPSLTRGSWGIDVLGTGGVFNAKS